MDMAFLTREKEDRHTDSVLLHIELLRIGVVCVLDGLETKHTRSEQIQSRQSSRQMHAHHRYMKRRLEGYTQDVLSQTTQAQRTDSLRFRKCQRLRCEWSGRKMGVDPSEGHQVVWMKGEVYEGDKLGQAAARALAGWTCTVRLKFICHKSCTHDSAPAVCATDVSSSSLPVYVRLYVCSFCSTYCLTCTANLLMCV